MHGSRHPAARSLRDGTARSSAVKQLWSDQRVGSSNLSGRANARVYKVLMEIYGGTGLRRTSTCQLTE